MYIYIYSYGDRLMCMYTISKISTHHCTARPPLASREAIKAALLLSGGGSALDASSSSHRNNSSRPMQQQQQQGQQRGRAPSSSSSSSAAWEERQGGRAFLSVLGRKLGDAVGAAVAVTAAAAANAAGAAVNAVGGEVVAVGGRRVRVVKEVGGGLNCSLGANWCGCGWVGALHCFLPWDWLMRSVCVLKCSLLWE